jgi:hypothetical protein
VKFKTLTASAVLAAVVFGYPLLAENVGNPCAALERRMDNSGIVSFFSNGALASAALKEHWPAVPSMLSCTFVYWTGREASPETAEGHPRVPPAAPYSCGSAHPCPR